MMENGKLEMVNLKWILENIKWKMDDKQHKIFKKNVEVQNICGWTQRTRPMQLKAAALLNRLSKVGMCTILVHIPML